MVVLLMGIMGMLGSNLIMVTVPTVGNNYFVGEGRNSWKVLVNIARQVGVSIGAVLGFLYICYGFPISYMWIVATVGEGLIYF